MIALENFVNMFVTYVNKKPELCTYLQAARETRVEVFLHYRTIWRIAVFVMFYLFLTC